MSKQIQRLVAWLRRPIPAVLITATIIGLIAVADDITGERLDLSILYFIPITYIAWALGRPAAIISALASEVLYWRDELHLLQAGDQTIYVTVANVIFRLLVYLFVAEITSRLAMSMMTSRANAQDLEKANEHLKDTYAVLDEDIAAAGLLQASVMELKLPTLKGCAIGASLRYAGRTGGDFVDCGVVDGKLYVCVADISGKGTPAALFTALLKHLLEDALESGYRMEGVIARVNAALLGLLPVDRFITLFFAEIDPVTGVLDYINAGHPPALIYGLRTTQLIQLNPTTPILGVVELIDRVKSEQSQMYKGDTLVIYSDGATDSVGTDGKRLGDDTIKTLAIGNSALDPQGMADAIASDIEAMTIPEKRDDLSIICVRFTDEV